MTRRFRPADAATRSGAYFITACTQERRCLFGDIRDGVMHLNALGEIVQSTWLQPPPRQPQGLSRSALVVMPNHIHAIVRIQASAAAPICLRDEIRAFKSLVTQRINIVLDTPGAIVWERHAHEHLLRSDLDEERATAALLTNPQRWSDDALHPDVGQFIKGTKPGDLLSRDLTQPIRVSGEEGRNKDRL